VPDLEVGAPCPLALSSSLVDVASSLVERLKHVAQPIAGATSSRYGRTVRAQRSEVNTNASTPFADLRAVAQGLEYAADGVARDGKKKAGGQLLPGTPSVAERGCGVRELSRNQAVETLADALGIRVIERHCDAHVQVARALQDGAFISGPQKVGALQRGDGEVVEAVVLRSVCLHRRVKPCRIVLDIGDELWAEDGLRCKHGPAERPRRALDEV